MNLLFLCTGNSARSQMAEAFLRRYGGEHFAAYSAGLNPSTINPYTVRVMDELGFDLEGHRAKSVKEYLGGMNFAFVVTACTKAEKTALQPSPFGRCGSPGRSTIRLLSRVTTLRNCKNSVRCVIKSAVKL